MPFQTTLHVTAHDRRYTLIVEPWAEEFVIAVGDECAVVAFHPRATPTFQVEVGRDGDLIVTVNDGGSSFEFWRGRVREFQTQVAIPVWPPEDQRDAE